MYLHVLGWNPYFQRQWDSRERQGLVPARVIEEQRDECRFRDCGHKTEPDCAVLAAVARGALDPSRLSNYEKLRKELNYLDRRRDAAAQSEEKKRWKRIHKAMRNRTKLKG